MRKVCAAILSAAICLSVSGAPAWASEHQPTLSAGYLHARTNAPGSDNLNGINVKYRYEFTDALGLITSFSYANAEDEQKTHYSDTRWHEDSVRNRWFSVMAVSYTHLDVYKRRMLANTCMWTYRSDECGYTGGAVADEFDKPTTAVSYTHLC